jgi:tyrosine-protein kinase receptor torso
MWEIMTDGETPYAHLSNKDVIDALQAGERLEKPQKCGSDIFALMASCWNIDAEKRQNFEEICNSLSKFKALPELPTAKPNPSQQHLYFNTYDAFGNLK